MELVREEEDAPWQQQQRQSAAEYHPSARLPPSPLRIPAQSILPTAPLEANPFSLPAAPTHDPRASRSHISTTALDNAANKSATSASFRTARSSSVPQHPQHQSPLSTRPRQHSLDASPSMRPTSLLTADAHDGSEEEALEELEDEDDEVEEMAEEHHISSGSSISSGSAGSGVGAMASGGMMSGAGLAGGRRMSEDAVSTDRIETTKLVDVTRNVCLTTVQNLLNGMAHSPSHLRLTGGTAMLDTLLRTASEASAGLLRLDATAQDKKAAHQTINTLSELVQQSKTDVDATGTTITTSSYDDLTLVHALTLLLVILDSPQWQTATAIASDPADNAKIRSAPPAQSTFTIAAQRMPGGHGSAGMSATGTVIASSPSSSREELRNPFADEGSRLHPNPSDERWRERIQGSADESLRLLRFLDELERRCESTGAPVQTEAKEADEQPSDHIARLQTRIAACRSLLTQRRSDLLIGATGSHRRSVSPSSHSPTYGMSQRSSRASSPAFGTPPSDASGVLAGDPMGEALAAGMGIGAPRSLSRRSSATGRSGVTFVPTPPPQQAPLLLRRGSTKSESGHSQTMQSSPPPRYSEDSTRSWASVTFPPLSVSEAGAISPLAALPQQRRRSTSSDNSHGYLTGPPAYAHEGLDQAIAGAGERKGSASSASIAVHSEKASISLRQARQLEKGQNGGIQERRVSSATRRPATAGATMHPAQELKMLQNSIDRLYDAAPQMSDQRAGLPDPALKAKQREHDFAQMVDRMGKIGRLDDQRATPPVASSSTRRTSREVRDDGRLWSDPSAATAQQQPAKSRRFPSVGSINLASLSMRRASQLLDSTPLRSAKGKERSMAAVSTDAEADDEDLAFVAAHLHAASVRGGLDDQRAPARQKGGRMAGSLNGGQSETMLRVESDDSMLSSAPSPLSPRESERTSAILSDHSIASPTLRRGKKSKLAMMGIEPMDDSTGNAVDDDDVLLGIMEHPSMRRMANQDAVMRPSSYSSSSPSVATSDVDANAATLFVSGLPASSSSSLRAGESTLRASDSDARADDGVGNRGRIAALTGGDERKGGELRLCCVAETQDRLGVMSVVLWQDATAVQIIDTLTCDLHDEPSAANAQAHSVLAMRADQDTTSTINFALPSLAALDTAQPTCSPVRQADCWTVRIPMHAMRDDEIVDGSPAAPFSAASLAALRPQEWRCRTCSSVVAETSSASKYVPLPSQHWEELVDAWMCHTDQELNVSLLQAQNDMERHAGVERGQVHISDTHVIVARSALHPGASVDEKTQRIVCQTCRATLGSAGEASAAKLLKLAIQPFGGEGGATKETMPPLSAFVAHDLTRSSHVHATRHFRVVSEDGEDGPTISIWLFLDRFRAAVMESEASVPRIFAAAKVMFRLLPASDLNAGTSNDAASAHWTSPATVDQVSYPTQVCRELLAALYASNAVYPPSQRTFAAAPSAQLDGGAGPWLCGFLPFA